MTGSSLREQFEQLTAEIDRLRTRAAELADQRARLIAEEVARRGRGGARTLANELGVHEARVSQLVARARKGRAE
ncbi:hypothetical protein SacglDRAFT_00005 (plasmid) [Saccharomonospora glauca K62]|uniref:Uncharacterized protein n=1 Tax=Saccharomonospora glauca K62 TaxID=928724 RepID=I1D8E5_9PSEU|nr:hypothetical protein SacglDRAFT_00005 [Saccharomonospora glauca K62]